MGIYNKDFNVEYKADESPVTDADLAAHKIIKIFSNLTSISFFLVFTVTG